MTDEDKHQRLKRALAQAGGTFTVSDVVAAHAAGKLQFWTNGRGHIFTEIEQYPQLRVVNYFLVFGELGGCLELEHEINPWAIENGCTVATACGRRGWARAAAPTGWKLRGYQYAKVLSDGR